MADNTKNPAASAKPGQRNRLIYTLLAFFCCFALLSSWSYSWTDWPSPRLAGHPWPVENLCGPAGAWLAYQLLSFLGYGVFVLFFLAGGFCLLRALNRAVSDLPLRAIGLSLTVFSVSATAYIILPSLDVPRNNPLPFTAGGVLGLLSGTFLLSQLSRWGTALVVTASAAVGLVLAADRCVGFFSRLIWSRLRILLAKIPVLQTVFAKALAPQPALPLIRSHHTNPELNVPAGGGTAVALQESEEQDDQGDQQQDDQEEDEEESLEQLRVKIHGLKSGRAKKLPNNVRLAAQPDKSSKGLTNYKLPPLDLLEQPEYTMADMQEQAVREKAVVLEKTLSEFNIKVTVTEIDTGPTITLFEISLSPGTKVAQIRNLANDLARALGVGSVRIVAPIPGKQTIGVEIPNCEKEMVRMRELVDLSQLRASRMKLPLFLAKDASGQPLVADLTTMPHMLIAGATGSGKSVCINSIVTSVLMTQRPDHVKLILVDPKMVEMAQFQDIPHLMCPIINDLARAESVLEWAVTKMEERYAILREAAVRNLSAYNRLSSDQILDRFKPGNDQERAQIPMHLPYIVIIIDELADLIITASKEVENYIIRLAQKSRAVGIHLIVATQRPSVNVVTGLIKSNLPCRISFRVASRQESRIVLDHNGAETLLGRGDMLFLQPGTDQLTRAQGAIVEDREIAKIIEHLRAQAEPEFNAELSRLSYTDADGQALRDPLFDQAVETVLSSQRASVSLIKRRFNIPFERASTLIDLMGEAGVVGPERGSQAREILITTEEWRRIKTQVARDAADGYADLEDDDHAVPATIDNQDIRD